MARTTACGMPERAAREALTIHGTWDEATTILQAHTYDCQFTCCRHRHDESKEMRKTPVSPTNLEIEYWKTALNVPVQESLDLGLGQWEIVADSGPERRKLDVAEPVDDHVHGADI